MIGALTLCNIPVNIGKIGEHLWVQIAYVIHQRDSLAMARIGTRAN